MLQNAARIIQWLREPKLEFTQQTTQVAWMHHKWFWKEPLQNFQIRYNILGKVKAEDGRHTNYNIQIIVVFLQMKSLFPKPLTSTPDMLLICIIDFLLQYKNSSSLIKYVPIVGYFHLMYCTMFTKWIKVGMSDMWFWNQTRLYSFVFPYVCSNFMTGSESSSYNCRIWIFWISSIINFN